MSGTQALTAVQLTHEKIYADPRYEKEPSSEFTRGTILGIEEQPGGDGQPPTISAHYLRGEGYELHADLNNDYLRRQKRPPLDGTDNSVFGGVEIDGVNRTALLQVRERARQERRQRCIFSCGLVRIRTLLTRIGIGLL